MRHMFISIYVYVCICLLIRQLWSFPNEFIVQLIQQCWKKLEAPKKQTSFWKIYETGRSYYWKYWNIFSNILLFDGKPRNSKTRSVRPSKALIVPQSSTRFSTRSKGRSGSSQCRQYFFNVFLTFFIFPMCWEVRPSPPVILLF